MSIPTNSTFLQRPETNYSCWYIKPSRQKLISTVSLVPTKNAFSCLSYIVHFFIPFCIIILTIQVYDIFIYYILEEKSTLGPTFFPAFLWSQLQQNSLEGSLFPSSLVITVFSFSPNPASLGFDSPAPLRSPFSRSPVISRC
jgi:hypothetical protein